MQALFGSTPAIKAAAFYLRYQVFVLEQGIPKELEFDSLDDATRQYYVLFDQEVPIGTVRYQTDDALTLHPDRLCVAKKYRQQKIGSRLLTFIETKARSNGCLYSVLSAEVTAADFYKKLGYQQNSAIYLEDGIPCIQMTKDLSDS